MRSWMRSILAFFTVGSVAMTGCNQPDKQAVPPATTDVVLNVPGMY